MGLTGRYYVTPHAVTRFQERVAPGMLYERALALIIWGLNTDDDMQVQRIIHSIPHGCYEAHVQVEDGRETYAFRAVIDPRWRDPATGWANAIVRTLMEWRAPQDEIALVTATPSPPTPSAVAREERRTTVAAPNVGSIAGRMTITNAARNQRWGVTAEVAYIIESVAWWYGGGRSLGWMAAEVCRRTGVACDPRWLGEALRARWAYHSPYQGYLTARQAALVLGCSAQWASLQCRQGVWHGEQRGRWWLLRDRDVATLAKQARADEALRLARKERQEIDRERHGSHPMRHLRASARLHATG